MASFRRYIWRSFQILIALLIPVLILIAFLQKERIYDWIRLRNYEPPAQIESLAQSTTMTSYGRRLFFVHKPELNDRDTFNKHCGGHEQTIVLGCYITHRNIYIFDVTDARLQGIEEVTAAHEMLHAAYDRLDKGERDRINALTNEQFLRLNNSRIKSVIASYEARDASVVANELHSILATEVRDLSAELENYYAQYFMDRKKIVGYSERYEAVFTEQQKHIESLAQQIDKLHGELEVERVTIDQLEAALSSEAANLELLKNRGDVEAYNEGVPAYNRKVGTYRTFIERYNEKVKRLNALVAEHNALAVEQKELINAINSNQQSLSE